MSGRKILSRVGRFLKALGKKIENKNFSIEEVDEAFEASRKAALKASINQRDKVFRERGGQDVSAI